MKAFVFVFVVLSYILLSCNAYTWSDCATPLMKAFYYESVTIFPSDVVVNERLSLNIRATVVEHINNAGTNIEIVKDGVTFLNTTSRDLCTILYNNDLSCPVPVGKLSYTYKVDAVPTLPAGRYHIKITNFLGRRILGCLRVALDVKDPNQEGSCTYESKLSTHVKGEIKHEKGDDILGREVGDWVQIGPKGDNAGTAASGFPWGTFESLDGTYDIVGTGFDISRLVWAINGTMVAKREKDQGQLQEFSGDLFVGYLSNGTTTGRIDPILTGTFDWDITANPGDARAEILQGELRIRPKWGHPRNFTYPLLVGNLNPLKIEQSSGTMAITGSMLWCTCGVDACGVCGGDGTSCVLGEDDDGLSLYAQGATAIGIAGGIVGIAAIVFFAYQIRKMRREPAIDDLDLVDPEKPDYGTMAINEVLQEGDPR